MWLSREPHWHSARNIGEEEEEELLQDMVKNEAKIDTQQATPTPTREWFCKSSLGCSCSKRIMFPDL